MKPLILQNPSEQEWDPWEVPDQLSLRILISAALQLSDDVQVVNVRDVVVAWRWVFIRGVNLRQTTSLQHCNHEVFTFQKIFPRAYQLLRIATIARQL